MENIVRGKLKLKAGGKLKVTDSKQSKKSKKHKKNKKETRRDDGDAEERYANGSLSLPWRRQEY
jgi:hypothetical protein